MASESCEDNEGYCTDDMCGDCSNTIQGPPAAEGPPLGVANWSIRYGDIPYVGMLPDPEIEAERKERQARATALQKELIDLFPRVVQTNSPGIIQGFGQFIATVIAETQIRPY